MGEIELQFVNAVVEGNGNATSLVSPDSSDRVMLPALEVRPREGQYPVGVTIIFEPADEQPMSRAVCDCYKKAYESPAKLLRLEAAVAVSKPRFVDPAPLVLQPEFSTAKVRVEARWGKQTRAVELRIEVLIGQAFKENSLFTGTAIIDLGTSSSTVTLRHAYGGASGVMEDEAVPWEQRDGLQNQLVEWLNSSAPPGFSKEWLEFKKHVADDASLCLLESGYNTENTNDRRTWLDGVQGVETAIKRQTSPDFRDYAYLRLSHIFERALSTPPLHSYGIKCLVLEEARPVIPSELEIINGFQEPLGAEIGKRARQNRSAALAESNKWEFRQLEATFHPSPKHYLSTRHHRRRFQWKDRAAKGDQRQRAFDELKVVQAAYAQLMARSGFRFDRVITTYPTVSAKPVRDEIRSVVEQLGEIRSVRQYDEATAAAIFYLWLEYCCNPDLNLERFKLGRAQVGGKWVRNMLFIDIGGGTTDIALLEFELSEESPVDDRRESGVNRGRYYRLTPRVRHSSGRFQLGGELLTLRIFEILKVLLTRHMILVGRRLGTDYDAGKALKDLTKGQKDNYRKSEFYERALSFANVHIPSRWNEVADADKQIACSRFFALWAWAEDIKISFAQELEKEASLQKKDFRIAMDDLNARLQIEKARFHEDAVIEYKYVKAALEPVLEKMVKLGTDIGLAHKGDLQADWIVLSGQTCKLPLLKSILKKELKRRREVDASDESESINGRQSRLSSPKITFRPEYSKKATSIGAALMDLLESRVLPPDAVEGILRSGQNHVKLDVRNLFFFMPCSLIREGQQGKLNAAEMPLIAINQPLLCRNTAEKRMGKARSRWVKWMQENSIIRKDSNGEEHDWGHYRKEFLEDEKFVDFDDEKLWIQLETDHVLNSVLYIRYGSSTRVMSDLEAKTEYRADSCVRDGRVEVEIGVTSSGGLWKPIFQVGDILDEGLEMKVGGRSAQAKKVIVRELELNDITKVATFDLFTRKGPDARPETLCSLTPQQVDASFPMLYCFFK